MMKHSLVGYIIGLFLIVQAQAQSIQRDLQLGEDGYQEVVSTMGIYEFEAMDTLVKRLGARLVAQIEQPIFNYEFYLVDSPEPNAFALPGGKVFVTRGLLVLPLNEDELAGVMGHEIIHSQNRHTIKQQRNGIFGALIALPGMIIGGIFKGPVGQAVATPFIAGGELLHAQYSQGHEKEADREGIELAAKAGYDPYLLASLLSRLSLEAELLTGEQEEKSYFASHPYTPKRIQKIQKMALKLDRGAYNPIAKPDSFLYLLNGLLLSPNPEHGFEDDGIFYHPDHELEIAVPENWITASTPQSVGLASKDGDAMLTFLFEEDTITAIETINQIKTGMQQYNGAKPEKDKTFSWYNHSGAMLEYVGNSSEGEVKMQIYALDLENGVVLKIAAMFLTKKQSAIENLLQTAKPEKRADMPKAEVLRVKSVFVKAGERLEEVIRFNGADEQSSLIVLINELPASHVFAKDQFVKIIVKDLVSFE